MTHEIPFCDLCHRVVRTHAKATAIGNIRVPHPHLDHEGKPCDGARGEVQTAWDPDLLAGAA